MADIPDVWNYVGRGDSSAAGRNWTGGYNAGVGAVEAGDRRRAQQEDMSRRSLQAERSDALDREELERRKKADEQRAAGQAKELKQQQLQADQKLEQFFGPDLIRDEEGNINIQASSMNQLGRQQRAVQEKALGQREAMQGWEIPNADSSLRGTDNYNLGFNIGQLSRMEQDSITMRAQEANRVRQSEGDKTRTTRLEAAKISAGRGGDGDDKGIHVDKGVVVNKNGNPVSEFAAREYWKAHPEQRPNTAGTNASPSVITIKKKEGGGWMSTPPISAPP